MTNSDNNIDHKPPNPWLSATGVFTLVTAMFTTIGCGLSVAIWKIFGDVASVTKKLKNDIPSILEVSTVLGAFEALRAYRKTQQYNKYVSTISNSGVVDLHLLEDMNSRQPNFNMNTDNNSKNTTHVDSLNIRRRDIVLNK